jgi:hypothetical protein
MTSSSLLEALGMLYIDREVTRADAAVGYKVEVSYNGNVKLLYRQYLREVQYQDLPFFRLYKRMASDSLVTATWYATGTRGLYARVFASVNNKGFIPGERTVTYARRDTVFVTYSTTARPGDQVSLFVRPTDLPGNLGRASDTVKLLAISFNNTSAVKNLRATDTLGGILLRWDSLPRKMYYTGIRVMKSRSASDGFIVLDTLPAGSSSYLDTKIIAGTQYYYVVEPILYDLPQRGRVTPVMIPALAKTGKRTVAAPQGLRPALTDDRNIRLSWLPNSELRLFAYYVLRGTSKENMVVVSEAVRDTVFVDSLKNLNAGTTYLYAVRAMDMDMQWSDTSETVSVAPPKARVVVAPAGLSARYTEQGVRLHWNDVRIVDASVIGYFLYKRKKGEKYFTPLSTVPVQGEYFTDTAIGQAGIYEYGCTSADAWGNQSIVSPLAEVNIMGRTWLYPPAGFSLRNLSAGIEISIPLSLNAGEGQNKYIIYRRLASDRAYRKVGEVPVSSSVFVDKQVSKEQLYVYVISRKQQEMESVKTGEKAIRRK